MRSSCSPRRCRPTRAQTEPECGGVTGNPELSIKACTRAIEFGSLERPSSPRRITTRRRMGELRAITTAPSPTSRRRSSSIPKLAGAFTTTARCRGPRKASHDRAIADYDAALQLSSEGLEAPTSAARSSGPSRATTSAPSPTTTRRMRLGSERHRAVVRARPRALLRGRLHGRGVGFRARAPDRRRASTRRSGFFSRASAPTFPARRRSRRRPGRAARATGPRRSSRYTSARARREAVQKAAAHPDPARQRDQRCEANFYIAQWHLLRGAREPAVRLLREARRAMSQRVHRARRRGRGAAPAPSEAVGQSRLDASRGAPQSRGSTAPRARIPRRRSPSRPG